MKLIFLGTGTSTGIPQIGCKCKVCSSTDERDKRLRASVMIQYGDQNILIDCGPDFRQQMLSHNFDTLSAVLITHEHYDHLGGLDDVRPFGNITVYAEERVNRHIMDAMPYCFREKLYPGVPLIKLVNITEEAFVINDLTIQPIRVMHAKLPILGFRIGTMAYLTDVKSIADETLEQLRNLDVLILTALRLQPHIAHLTLGEAVELARKIGAKRTFFTHFSHDLGLHGEVEDQLPENLYLSFDNLEIEF